MLLALVGEELGLDHFDLLFFLLFLDTEVVFLLCGHVGLDKVHVVGVASENTLVVHNVEGFTIIDFLVVIEPGGFLGLGFVLGFLAYDLGLGSLEGL